MNDATLVTLLTEDVHLDDAGFTDRVVKRLPAPRRTPSVRAIVLFGSSALAAAVGAAVLAEGGIPLLEAAHTSWVRAAGALVVVGVALWGALSAAES